MGGPSLRELPPGHAARSRAKHAMVAGEMPGNATRECACYAALGLRGC
jgi:hypothetical protein